MVEEPVTFVGVPAWEEVIMLLEDADGVVGCEAGAAFDSVDVDADP
jgi:hypothetical protein